MVPKLMSLSPKVITEEMQLHAQKRSKWYFLHEKEQSKDKELY